MRLIWQSTENLLQIKKNLWLEPSWILIFEKDDQVQTSKMSHLIQNTKLCSSVIILLLRTLVSHYEQRQENAAV